MNALDFESLRALERRVWDALCASGGGALYGDRMLSDALMILVNGAVLDRAAVGPSLVGALSEKRWVCSPGRW